MLNIIKQFFFNIISRRRFSFAHREYVWIMYTFCNILHVYTRSTNTRTQFIARKLKRANKLYNVYRHVNKATYTRIYTRSLICMEGTLYFHDNRILLFVVHKYLSYFIILLFFRRHLRYAVLFSLPFRVTFRDCYV